MMNLPPLISLPLASLFVCASITPLPLRAQPQTPAARHRHCQARPARQRGPHLNQSARLAHIHGNQGHPADADQSRLRRRFRSRHGGPSCPVRSNTMLTAKPEGGGSLDQERLKPLLQKLLEQRFNLAVHREKKDVQGYALVVAKGAPTLQATKGDAPHAYILRGGLQLQNYPVAMLASILSSPVGRPVIDSTGIKGNYDLKITCAGGRH